MTMDGTLERADPRHGPLRPEKRRIFFEGASSNFDLRFHSTPVFDHGQHHRYSIQELTSLLVSGLEDARKRDGEVDAGHVVAELGDGIRRRDRSLEQTKGGDDHYEDASSLTATHVAGDGRCRWLRHSTRSLGALAVRSRNSAGSYPQARASAPCLAEFQADPLQPGIKLNLSNSAASIATADGTLDFRNRLAMLTLGFPKVDLSFQIRLTSRRERTCTPVAEDSPLLGYGAAACALVAAVILLYALPEVRTKQPQRPSLSFVQRDEKSVPTPSLPLFPPISSMLTRPLEQEPRHVEPASVGMAAPEHVATRTMTDIRMHPEPEARVIRVVPGRLILTVHARDNGWVQVGGTEAWGWVPSNLLDAFVSKDQTDPQVPTPPRL